MSDYRIIPPTPSPYVLPVSEASDIGYGRSIPLGCGVTIALFILFLIGWAIVLALLDTAHVMTRDSSPIAMVILTFLLLLSPPPIGFIAAYLINRSWRKRQIANLEGRRNVELNESVARYAQEETDFANRLLIESSQYFSQLSQLLHKTSSFTQLAEREFNEGVIDPFWDAIENAVDCLIEFKATVDILSLCAERYHATLSDKQHNFPPFPIRRTDLPDTTQIVHRLHGIIRTGQNKENYEFARAWSERRQHQTTRAVLRQEFRTLRDAIANIGPDVAQSISNLQSALSSDISQVVEEQYKTRQTINDFARGY